MSSTVTHPDYDDPDWAIDPDQVNVPESLDHREFTETLAQFTALALGPAWRIVRNMAWYPTPTERAMAPDVMVLPVEFVPDGTTSYRQAIVGGPTPTMVVEVLSDGNSLTDGLAKLRRYANLGVPALLIDVHERTAERFEPSGTFHSCVGAPLPELGGVRIVSDDEGLLIEGVDARRARRIDDAARQLVARAQAETARAQAETARTERLAEALRALGADPATI